MKSKTLMMIHFQRKHPASLHPDSIWATQLHQGSNTTVSAHRAFLRKKGMTLQQVRVVLKIVDSNCCLKSRGSKNAPSNQAAELLGSCTKQNKLACLLLRN